MNDNITDIIVMCNSRDRAEMLCDKADYYFSAYNSDPKKKFYTLSFCYNGEMIIYWDRPLLNSRRYKWFLHNLEPGEWTAEIVHEPDPLSGEVMSIARMSQLLRAERRRKIWEAYPEDKRANLSEVSKLF